MKSKTKFILTALCASVLSACSQLKYQPIDTISQINPNQGYRIENQTNNLRTNEDIYFVLLISGGGSRAASLGYGVLEALKDQSVVIRGKPSRLIDEVDVVSGVSGGSVIATYFALHGADAIPSFEKRFLSQDFQGQIISQVFSFANMPRLTSPQFGRGDLLQEQFEQTLFGNTTFGDLANHRKGPFAIISATDMTQGVRVTFTQEFFDMLCLNLSALPLARAVAASSSVPMVFSPLTLNNNGGNCGYNVNKHDIHGVKVKNSNASQETLKALQEQAAVYSDSKNRPFIHLVDGGLTDNVGLSTLLQGVQMTNPQDIYQKLNGGKASKIVLMTVNAQNQTPSEIDKSADIPGLSDALNAVINIPIDKVSTGTISATRTFVDEWNKLGVKNQRGDAVKMYFVDLELKNLENTELRQKTLNISTSFYLPKDDVNNLRLAAKELLKQSKSYQELLVDLK